MSRKTVLDPSSVALILLPLFAAAISTGCSDTSASSGGSLTIAPETQELYRIGSLSGGSWETFSEVAAVGFDADANLYVLDSTERRVTVVDSGGDFIRTVGEAGDGPGQFRRPLTMAVLSDGRVVVSDAGHRGLLLFNADGTYDRAIPLPDGVGAPSILLADGDDALIYPARRIMMMGGMMGGARGSEPPSKAPIHRLMLDGDAEVDVLHEAWLPPRVQPQVGQGSGGTTRIMRSTIRAFEPELHVALMPDGSVAVADSTAYRIDIIDQSRGTRNTIERPFQPTPVTDRERESEKERRLREVEAGGGPPVTVMGPGGAAPSIDASQRRAMLESQLESMVFWPEIPVIQEFAADAEGRLWVRRFGDIDEPGPIEILSRDGHLRAMIPADSLAFPAAFGPNDLAAWVERDELDVPFVRVARLMDIP